MNYSKHVSFSLLTAENFSKNIPWAKLSTNPVEPSLPNSLVEGAKSFFAFFLPVRDIFTANSLGDGCSESHKISIIDSSGIEVLGTNRLVDGYDIR